MWGYKKPATWVGLSPPHPVSRMWPIKTTPYDGFFVLIGPSHFRHAVFDGLGYSFDIQLCKNIIALSAIVLHPSRPQSFAKGLANRAI